MIFGVVRSVAAASASSSTARLRRLWRCSCAYAYDAVELELPGGRFYGSWRQRQHQQPQLRSVAAEHRRRRQLDFPDWCGAAVRKPATWSSLSYVMEITAAAPSSRAPRQQRRRRQLDFAACSGAAARTPATRSSQSYLENASAAASSSDSSSHSCAVTPRQQRRRRQLDLADCGVATMRAAVLRSSLSLLEETSSAAATSVASSSHNCAVSPRQQRRRRQPDYADCNEAAALATVGRWPLRHHGSLLGG